MNTLKKLVGAEDGSGSSRDRASLQMAEWQKSVGGQVDTPLTASNGRPLDSLTDTQTLGPRGPTPMQDFNFMDHMTAFDRERAPERVVHANGAGAFGYWETTTADAAKYCKAKMFDTIGKRVPMVARFSTVGGETGSPDTARDPRGFSLKFYTEEGNWDMVANNTPIFFIADPILFPSFIHTQKRNPVTHLKDPDMFWDFLSLRPESVHQTTVLFSDRGTPDGYRHMNGYGSHTFKSVNASGEAVWVKYHFKTDQGIANLPAEKADELAGSDPDYATRDLYNAIADGDFPSWTAYIQVMPYEEAWQREENPFDVTKTWSHKEFPLIEIGRFTLNKNPSNYFTDIECAAYDPANLIPGIEPSPDKMLQGRLISYTDAHKYRIGGNYLQLPVNRAINTKVANYARDGPMRIDNQGGAPNYFPNSFGGPQPNTDYAWHADKGHKHYGGDAQLKRWLHSEDNYTQCSNLYNKVFDEGARDRLTTNIAGHLGNAAPFIQERMVNVFSKVDPSYGKAVAAKLADNKAAKEKLMAAASAKNVAPLNPPRNVPKSALTQQ